MTKVCDLDHEKFMDTFTESLKHELRNRWFHSLSVWKIMDKHGGVLSYEVFNLLQKVENKSVKLQKLLFPLLVF